jgi:hypothetical protein
MTTLSTRKAKKNTPEHNAKIAAAHRGKKLSPEHREKCRLASLGRKQTPQEIEARRLANTGKKRSPEFCELMRQLQANRTPEQKAAQSEHIRQRNLNKTPEQKEKERLALVARNKARAGEKRQFPPTREAGSTDPVFYVYEHWRSDTGQPFYVGKGFKKRAYQMTMRNRHHMFAQDYLKRIGALIEVKIVAVYLTEREALDLEIELIEKWLTSGCKLVNITKGGDGPTGRKHTEEWKRAMSERMKGRKMSPEARAKIAASAIGNKRGLGKKKPQHVVDAMRALFTGKPKSEETKRKISESKKGKPWNGVHSPELLARRSAEMTGIPFSEERKLTMRGIPKSETHKQKLREINLGKTHDEETRKLLSEIAKADWARRKAKKALETGE